MLSQARAVTCLVSIEDACLAGADRLRAALLARLGRVPQLAELRRVRALRLTAVACLLVGFAFVAAVRFTPLALMLAPVLFGVPHLVSDVRYLLLPRHERPVYGPSHIPRRVWPLFAVAAGLGLLGWGTAALGAAGAAVVATALSRTKGWSARAGLLGAGVLGAVAVAAHRDAVALLLCQGHNWVALGIGAWFLRGKMRAGWLPTALLLGGVAAIALGGCDAWLERAAEGQWGRTALREAWHYAAPRGAPHVVVLRCAALFAFAQAVHYSMWLSLVPDAERSSERPVSFRRSFQLLCADLGSAGARLAILGSLALPVLACCAPDLARHSYVGLAVFHGFLELSWLAARLAAPLGAWGAQALAWRFRRVPA